MVFLKRIYFYTKMGIVNIYFKMNREEEIKFEREKRAQEIGKFHKEIAEYSEDPNDSEFMKKSKSDKRTELYKALTVYRMDNPSPWDPTRTEENGYCPAGFIKVTHKFKIDLEGKYVKENGKYVLNPTCILIPDPYLTAPPPSLPKPNVPEGYEAYWQPFLIAEDGNLVINPNTGNVVTKGEWIIQRKYLLSPLMYDDNQ